MSSGLLELEPGTHDSVVFDPFAASEPAGRVRYTVPAGWAAKGDLATVYTLLAVHEGTGEMRGHVIQLMAQPRVADDIVDGVPCGQSSDAPDVGGGVDDIVAAIRAKPGVVASEPVPVTISGYQGRLLDIRQSPAWTEGCQAPEGKLVTVALLREDGTSPGPDLSRAVWTASGWPVRLILLDLTGGRTLAVAISIDETVPEGYGAALAEAMSIVDSVEIIDRPTP